LGRKKKTLSVRCSGKARQRDVATPRRLLYYFAISFRESSRDILTANKYFFDILGEL
jgi:hypothetical protein